MHFSFCKDQEKIITKAFQEFLIKVFIASRKTNILIQTTRPNMPAVSDNYAEAQKHVMINCKENKQHILITFNWILKFDTCFRYSYYLYVT